MPVTVKRCPRCRARTISGLTLLGFDVVLDEGQLDPAGELEAILGGRRTYTLHTVAEQIAERPARVITARPAGSRPRQTVHPQHRCESGRQ